MPSIFKSTESASMAVLMREAHLIRERFFNTFLTETTEFAAPYRTRMALAGT